MCLHCRPFSHMRYGHNAHGYRSCRPSLFIKSNVKPVTHFKITKRGNCQIYSVLYRANFPLILWSWASQNKGNWLLHSSLLVFLMTVQHFSDTWTRITMTWLLLRQISCGSETKSIRHLLPVYQSVPHNSTGSLLFKGWCTWLLIQNTTAIIINISFSPCMHVSIGIFM